MWMLSPNVSSDVSVHNNGVCVCVCVWGGGAFEQMQSCRQDEADRRSKFMLTAARMRLSAASL